MIELFKQPNLDWMGKAKYFYALSGILLLAGWASIFFGSGIRYGIDFKGGTNVDVRFAQPPNIDKLRDGLKAQGLGSTEIQSISDIANPNSNEVVIFVEGKGQDDAALQASREKVLTALSATYGVPGSNKADFNSATPASPMASHRGFSLPSKTATRSVLSPFATSKSSAPRSAPSSAPRQFWLPYGHWAACWCILPFDSRVVPRLVSCFLRREVLSGLFFGCSTK
jgi:hypothetical protein